MQDDARQHRADGMYIELEGSHHAEVAATSTDGPKEILVFAGACGDESSSSKHDFSGAQIVERQSMFPYKPSETPAQREAPNTRNRDESSGGGEAVRL